MGEVKKSSGRANIILAALATAVIGGLIWALSEQSNWYERDAANRSRYYAREAEDQIAERCSRLVADDQAKCVDEAVQTARQNQREEQDLAAQKVTAWWTRIMGGAAITGMVLSALGVYLVWATFRETRRTANASMRATIATEKTTDLALAQSDPRIDIQCSIEIQPRGADDVVQLLQVCVSNVGYSTALGFRIERCKLSVDGIFADLDLTPRDNTPADLPRDGPSSQRWAVYEIPIDSLNNPTARDRQYTGRLVRVELAYWYRTVLDRDVPERGVWSGNFLETMTPDGMVVTDVRAHMLRTV